MVRGVKALRRARWRAGDGREGLRRSFSNVLFQRRFAFLFDANVPKLIVPSLRKIQ